MSHVGLIGCYLELTKGILQILKKIYVKFYDPPPFIQVRFTPPVRYDEGNFTNYLSVVCQADGVDHLKLNDFNMRNLLWNLVEGWDEYAYVTMELPASTAGEDLNIKM